MTPIAGARIRRIDRPADALLALELTGSRAVLLLVASRKVSGLGLVPARPRGRPIDAFGALLRKHADGAEIVAIEGAPEGARLVLRREAQLFAITARFGREFPGFALIDPQGRVVASTTRRPILEPAASPLDEDALLARGPELADAVAEVAREARRRAIGLALDQAIARGRRKLAAIEADAARVDDVALLRLEADLLVAHARDDRPGRDAIVVLDWSQDPPGERAIAIDPRGGPRAAAERRYQRARKLERGAAIAAERWEKTARSLEPLDALRRALDASEPELDAIEAQLEALGLAPREASVRTREIAARVPYREFRSQRGLPLLVGKSASDNDELTVRIARPHQLFVHVRGVPGSHVIVALDKGASCDEATLVDAATLAAHFSSLRGDETVEVLYAERRHVRKRRGSAPGSVQVDREKVMLLRVEPARLSRLLEGEIATPSKRESPRRA